MLAWVLGLLVLSPGADLLVAERDIRVRFHGETMLAVVPVTNDTDSRLPVTVGIDFLAPDGSIFASGSKNVLARRGESAVRIETRPSLLTLPANARRDLALYRIRYRVAPLSTAVFADAADGVVSVSETAPELFELMAFHGREVAPGRTLSVTVIARHPMTGETVGGVAVEAALTLDGVELGSASTKTSPGGVGLLSLPVPAEAESGTARLDLRGVRGAIEGKLEDEIWLRRQDDTRMSTDKRLYQPGQIMHLRMLAFDDARRALRDESAALRISGPDGNLAFATDIETSRFGVASTDWQIPEDARHGRYTIEVTFQGSGYSDALTYFRVSRYEVPEFAISVEPSRSFYLPGQRASVQVRARYLFDEPVSRASVRVTRSARFRFFDEEEKDEELVASGSMRADGTVSLAIDLEEAHAGLGRRRQFEDEDFNVIVTDETTGRTERGFFSLRASRHPLHVYAIAPDDGLSDQRHRLYVSTYTADGAPTSADVVIHDANTGEWLGHVRTNRFGVARVERMAPAPDEDSRTFTFTALDDAGNHGFEREYFRRHRETMIILTDKTLYRPGEPVHVTVRAPVEARRAWMRVARPDGAVRSFMVELDSGTAELTLDYESEFKGRVEIAVHSLDDERSGYSAEVLYPTDDRLKLTIEHARRRYLPGEHVAVSFDVRRPNGDRAEAAVGVVVVDEALRERERSLGAGDSFFTSESDPSTELEASRRRRSRAPIAPSPSLRIWISWRRSSVPAGAGSIRRGLAVRPTGSILCVPSIRCFVKSSRGWRTRSTTPIEMATIRAPSNN